MGIRLVARKIFRVKNGVDRDIIYRIRSAEYRGYALDDTAVVFDAFEASGDGLSRSSGCEKKHNIFSAYHRLYIVTENHLSVRVKFRFNNIDTLVGVHGHNAGIG